MKPTPKTGSAVVYWLTWHAGAVVECDSRGRPHSAAIALDRLRWCKANDLGWRKTECLRQIRDLCDMLAMNPPRWVYPE